MRRHCIASESDAFYFPYVEQKEDLSRKLVLYVLKVSLQPPLWRGQTKTPHTSER